MTISTGLVNTSFSLKKTLKTSRFKTPFYSPVLHQNAHRSCTLASPSTTETLAPQSFKICYQAAFMQRAIGHERNVCTSVRPSVKCVDC